MTTCQHYLNLDGSESRGSLEAGVAIYFSLSDYYIRIEFVVLESVFLFGIFHSSRWMVSCRLSQLSLFSFLLIASSPPFPLHTLLSAFFSSEP